MGLAVAAAGLAADAFWLEPSSLRVAPHELPQVMPVLAGMRIAVIADLHGGSNFITESKIDSVVAAADAASPDIILLTGDYVVSVERRFGGRHIPIETIVAHLKSLRAPLGVYAVIGNHDRWDSAERASSALRSVGIVVLENANIAIPAPKGTLYLAGIGDDYTHASNPGLALSGIPKGERALCFTHSPDVFPRLPATCALTVAGHTHGGQVWLPLLGPVFVPSRYGQRYASGLVQEGGKSLFVSTGIGTSILPVRFLVPPEISLLTIR
jgi:uncharacterized protein